MKCFLIPIILFLIYGCKDPARGKQPGQKAIKAKVAAGLSYNQIKDSIVRNRIRFRIKYPSFNELSKGPTGKEITNFWVNSISEDLFNKWENTSWDFNGTASSPKQGSIACGYFVTTMLRDMDFKLDRVKLAVCASSVMMKTLTPHQKVQNLSYLSYPEFNDKLKELGNGVYIVGLDFHTGFIVNDGKENWFIHSNYIKRVGVSKEAVLQSGALRSSKTRWLISLTADNDFLYKWLKG